MRPMMNPAMKPFKMMSLDISLLIFDMDGTLYDAKRKKSDPEYYRNHFFLHIQRNALALLRKRLHVDEKAALGLWCDVGEKYNKEYSIGIEKEYKIDRSVFFKKTWNFHVEDYVKKDRQLRDILIRMHIKKALLTAAPEYWATKVLKRLNIRDLFSAVYFGDGDIRKPNPAAYLSILKQCKTAAKDALYIDDEIRFLIPAKKLGMKTAFIDNVGISVSEEEAAYIDYRAKNIKDLLTMLSTGGMYTAARR
jgi:putative hydrolase of the HAD superfamily